MKNTITLFLLFAIHLGFCQSITLEPFATNLSSPVNIKHANDDRLFIVERRGFIQIINADGTKNSSPFLDIDAIVTDAGNERGLLAMAFHPDYENNGYFYVNYVDNSNNSGHTVISRFTRNSENTADAGSELILLKIEQDFDNHNGGDLHFGNDGFLYISLGDGGSGNDPKNRAQDLTTLLGKMLRIDVDNTSNGNNYAIPTDNPFVGNSTALPEIWAYGLRNPFKFSFDSNDGSLWIADVGQNQIEEINKVTTNTGGENYGWKCFEGTSMVFSGGNCNSISHTEPVTQYNHSSNRCSITGGYVYRGVEFPDLQGLYFFGDFCTNEIGYVEETSPDNYEIRFVDNFNIGGVSAFGEDSNGELYVTGINGGDIFKIIDNTLDLNNEDFEDVNMFPNPATSEVTFNFKNSSQGASIAIFDIQGKLALQKENLNSTEITLSTETLQNGFYLVEIFANSGAKTIKKLIIQ